MAEITMNLATASYEEYQAPFIESSKRYGATILLDGRANVNGDPMLFVGFETDIGFLWNSGINAGADKKSAIFIESCFREISSAENLPIAIRERLFATMQDNTIAVVSGGLLAQDNLHLVRLNCSLHMVALIATNIFTQVDFCAEQMEKLLELTSYVRSHPRVKAALKSIIEKDLPGQKAISLHRVMPIRMLTSRSCLQRVVLLHDSLYKLFSTANGSKLRQYFDEQDIEGKALFKRARDIARDDEFLLASKFLVDILTPVLQMTRFLDRANAKSREVYSLMRYATESLATVLGKLDYDEISKEAKRDILDIVATVWQRHQCPGHTAAWLLNPRERDTVTRLALSLNDDDRVEFLEAREETFQVVKIVLKRLAMFDSSIKEDVAFSQFELQFVQYVFDPAAGGFDASLSMIKSLKPEAWWAMQGNMIPSQIARIIMVWPAGTGNLERSMKINDRIHSKTRNRLTLSNADILTRGFVAKAASKCKSGWTQDDVDKFFVQFSALSDEEEVDLDRYYSTSAVSRQLQTVAQTVEMAEGIDGSAINVSDCEAPEQADESCNQDVDPEQDEEISPSFSWRAAATSSLSDVDLDDHGPRRSKRSAGLSAAFRAAVRALQDE
jgi:hypothetical protein